MASRLELVNKGLLKLNYDRQSDIGEKEARDVLSSHFKKVDSQFNEALLKITTITPLPFYKAKVLVWKRNLELDLIKRKVRQADYPSHASVRYTGPHEIRFKDPGKDTVLDLEETYSSETCSCCRGKGEEIKTCSTCMGRGAVTTTTYNYSTSRDETTTCACTGCFGKGAYNTQCSNCSGYGHFEFHQELSIYYTSTTIESDIYNAPEVGEVHKELSGFLKDESGWNDIFYNLRLDDIEENCSDTTETIFDEDLFAFFKDHNVKNKHYYFLDNKICHLDICIINYEYNSKSYLGFYSKKNNSIWFYVSHMESTHEKEIGNALESLPKTFQYVEELFNQKKDHWIWSKNHEVSISFIFSELHKIILSRMNPNSKDAKNFEERMIPERPEWFNKLKFTIFLGLVPIVMMMGIALFMNVNKSRSSEFALMSFLALWVCAGINFHVKSKKYRSIRLIDEVKNIFIQCSCYLAYFLAVTTVAYVMSWKELIGGWQFLVCNVVFSIIFGVFSNKVWDLSLFNQEIYSWAANNKNPNYYFYNFYRYYYFRTPKNKSANYTGNYSKFSRIKSHENSSFEEYVQSNLSCSSDPTFAIMKLYAKELRIMEITEAVGKEEISKEFLKRQYHSLSKKYHPDNGGSNQEFQKLNDAYETLIDKIAS